MQKLLIKATIEILEESFTRNLPADIQLSYFFKKNRHLGSHDRSDIAELYYGIIRNKKLLEEIVGSKNLNKAILIYFLVIQGRSINDLSLFAEDHEIEWLVDKKKNKTQIDSWPIKLSLPEWIWEKLISTYGEGEAIKLGSSFLNPASLNIRVNTLNNISVKEVVEELKQSFNSCKDKIVETKLSKLGISMPRGTAIQKSKLFLDGSIEVQEEGSQLLTYLLDAKRGHMVADFCAGAGGKSLGISAMMRNTGRIYAFDISEKRLANLKKRLKRSGASNISMHRINNENDLKVKRLKNKFDRVFVDAPCTGLGTLRRNPDLKWRHNEKSLSELTVKQASILLAASKLCKKGGYLVYATCSMLEDENEKIVASFLANNINFKILPQHKIMKKYEINLGEGDYFKLTTQQHKTDSFFGALMERID
jgi:16S rRNA (cytosine967-C5)-methyltransferase